MAASTVLLGCFLLASCVPCLALSNANGETYLKRTLNALENALDFFDEEVNHLNLDAIIGTRIVEGQLKVILERLDSGELKTTEDIEAQIRRVRRKADAVSDAATPNIQHTQPLYFQRIGTILGPEFWVLDYKSKDVNKSLILPQHMKGEAMHEEDSDDCLTELFGTGTSPDSSTTPCRVSRKCWDLMTSPGYRSYSLSHEVFYLQIGQLYGCFRGRMLPMLERLNAGFCANLYQEALEIAKANYPQNRRDFFMEIPALCGMVGYRQFFRDDWLEKVLGWQWPRGCYGAAVRRPRHHKDNSLDRFKREEKQLPDGCECHRTAVAIGALSQYVRYILEYLNLPVNEREV